MIYLKMLFCSSGYRIQFENATLQLKRIFFPMLLLGVILSVSLSESRAEAIVAGHLAAADFEFVVDSAVSQAKNTYRIFYGHSSHGAQIIQGLTMLQAENSFYAFNSGAGSLSITEYADDLGLWGDTSWVPVTRLQLDNPENDFNMVIWAWCGGVANNDEEGINIYLNAMNQLEQDYPEVTFIYMTGHLDLWAPITLKRNNQFIRDYCLANDKILFDFADIESYDPDGNYYPDDNDSCGWCYEWCTEHDCPTCSSCSHSHCLNCYLKGKAFWWLMATLAGGTDTVGCCFDLTGNVDCSDIEEPDISDITRLIDYLYLSKKSLCCTEEADVNVSGGQPDISDITTLIASIYLNFEPLPVCPQKK